MSIFSVCAFDAFDFRLCFARFEYTLRHFIGFRCETPKIFCSRLRRSQSKVLDWSGCAPKMTYFLVDDFDAI